jgi:hypothetical protein
LIGRRTGKRTARGLAASDEKEAALVAHDCSGLLDRRDILRNPAQHITDLMAFHPKAIDSALVIPCRKGMLRRSTPDHRNHVRHEAPEQAERQQKMLDQDTT